MLHDKLLVKDQKDADPVTISRPKGFMGGAAFTKNANIMHHFRIIYNDNNKARLFYKYSGKVTFLKNMGPFATA